MTCEEWHIAVEQQWQHLVKMGAQEATLQKLAFLESTETLVMEIRLTSGELRHLVTNKVPNE